MKTRIIIGVLLIVVTSIVAAIYMYQKPAATVVSGRAEFQLSAQEIFTAFDENESLANQKYLNRIIEVRGEVADVSAVDSLGMNVILASGNPLFGVSCSLPSGTNDVDLKVGDEVTVKGLCTGKLMDVVMVKCVVQN